MFLSVPRIQAPIEQKQRESAPQVEAALLEQQQKQLAAQGQLNPANPYGTPVSTPYTSGIYPPGAYAALRRKAILNTCYDDRLDVETLFHGAAVVIEPIAPRRPAQLVAGDATGSCPMHVPMTGGTI